MDRTKGTSRSPCQQSLVNQKLNCLKDIMDTVLQLSDEEWKALTKDFPKMYTRLEFAALCTKIVTSVSASVVKSYLPSLIDIFGMESVLQADAELQNSKAGSGCHSTTSTSSVSSSARTTVQRSPANVAAVIGDIVGNTLNDLKSAMQTAIWKVASVKASSRSAKLRTETCPMENEKKMLSGKFKESPIKENPEKGGKIYVLNEPLKEVDPDTAAITGKIVMVVLDVIEGSNVEQTDLQQTRGLLTAAAERIKLLASRANLYECIIQSTSEQIAPVTREEIQTKAARSVSKVLLNNVSVCTLSDSTELPTASMPCLLYSTSTEIVGTVVQNIQDTLSASGQSSHPDEQQTSDDFLTSGMRTDSGVFSATNRMFHTIHEKVKEFFNVSKTPVKHSDVEENNKADRISQLDDLAMNCTNDVCGEIISLYNSDFSESKCQTADGGETSEVLLTSHHEIHSVMKVLEDVITMSRSSSESSLTFLTGQRSKELLIPESVSVGKEFAPVYPLSIQYAGRIFSDWFQEKAVQTIADVLRKTEEKIFASVSTQYSTLPSPVTSEPDMPLSNAILGTWSGSSTELPSSLGTAELFTDSIPCHIDSISTDIVENIVQDLDIQDLDMVSTLEEVDMTETPSTSSAAHISMASGIMGVFLKQLQRFSSSVRRDDSGSLSEPGPPYESFLSAAQKIHRKIHKMVFGFVSEREELLLADSKVFINLHSSESAQHDVQSLLSKTSPQSLSKEAESSSEVKQVSHSPGFVSRVHSDYSISEKEKIAGLHEFKPIVSQSTNIQETINSDEFLSQATRVVSDVLMKSQSEHILDGTSTQTDFDSRPVSAHSLGSAAHRIAETIINGMDRVDADGVLSDSKSLSGSTVTSTPVNIFVNMQRTLQALLAGSFRKMGNTSLEPYDSNMSECRSSPLCLQGTQPAGDEAVSIYPVGESPTLHVDIDNYSNEVIGKVMDLFLHADQLPKSSSSELSKATQVVSDILVRMASSEMLSKGENDLDLPTGLTHFTTKPISEDMLCAASDVSGTVINVLHDFYESMHSKVADVSSNSDAFVGVLDTFSDNSLTLRPSGSNIVEKNPTAPLGILSKVRCHLRDFFMAFIQEDRPSLDTNLPDKQFMAGCSDSSSVSKMENGSLTAHVSGFQMMEDDKTVIPPQKIASTSQSIKEWQENHMNIDLCTDEVIARIVDLSKSELTDEYTLKDFHVLTSDHFQAKSTPLVSNILFKMVESCPLSNHQIAANSEEHHRKEFSELSKRVDSAASEISRSAGSTLKSFLATVSASENESGLGVKHSTPSASVTPLWSDVNLFTPLQLFIEVRNKLKGIFTPLLNKSDESNWISAVQERDADFTAVQDRDAQVADERALTQPLSQRLDSALPQLENLISEDTIREHARGIMDLTAEILRKDKTHSRGVDRSLSDSHLEMSGTRIFASTSVCFPSMIVHLFAEESIKFLLLYLLKPRTKFSHVGRPSQAASCTLSNQDMQDSRDNEVLSCSDRLTSEVSGQIEDPMVSHVGDRDATSSPASASPTPSIRTVSAEVKLGNLTPSSEENVSSSISSSFRFILKKKPPIIKLGWKFLKKRNLACRTSVASGQIKDPVVSDVIPDHIGTQRDCGATSSPASVSPTPSNSAGSAEGNLGNLTLSSEENLPSSTTPCLQNDSCLLDPEYAVVERKSSRFFSILKKRSSVMKFGRKKSNKVCPEKPTSRDLQADNSELSSCVESVNAVSSVEKPLKMVSRIFSAISKAFPKLSKAEPQ